MSSKVEKGSVLKKNEHNDSFNTESSATFSDLLLNWHLQTLRNLTFNLILKTTLKINQGLIKPTKFN